MTRIRHSLYNCLHVAQGHKQSIPTVLLILTALIFTLPRVKRITSYSLYSKVLTSKERTCYWKTLVYPRLDNEKNIGLKKFALGWYWRCIIKKGQVVLVKPVKAMLMYKLHFLRLKHLWLLMYVYHDLSEVEKD